MAVTPQYPKIYRVKGYHTIYFEGRRLISRDPAMFDFGKLNSGSVKPAQKPKIIAENGLIAKDILPEYLANLIASVFTVFVSRNHFYKLLITASMAALILHFTATRTPLIIPIFDLPDSLVYNILYVVAILTWHELGHAAVARRLGIRIDAIGIGAYFILPALFTRVSMVTLLPRNERIYVMFGGILFQSYCGIALALFYSWAQDPTILYLMQYNLLIACLNLIPFIRLDGYHIITEAIAIANENGRLQGFATRYKQMNRVAGVLFSGYIAYAWWRAAMALRDTATSGEIANFAFISLVIFIVVYRTLKPIAAKVLVIRRSLRP
jgi:Zn-dependent protease